MRAEPPYLRGQAGASVLLVAGAGVGDMRAGIASLALRGPAGLAAGASGQLGQLAVEAPGVFQVRYVTGALVPGGLSGGAGG